MQNSVYRLIALCPSGHHISEVEVYGYCSKGLPGLEVVGLGGFGRTIKEKIIFLSKQYGIKFPMKRYVLCIDLPASSRKERLYEESRWLELPLLILFWTLAGVLELDNLNDCVSTGKVQVGGSILCPQLNDFKTKGEYKFIVPSFVDIPSNGYLIPLEELFSRVGAEQIRYELVK